MMALSKHLRTPPTCSTALLLPMRFALHAKVGRSRNPISTSTLEAGNSYAAAVETPMSWIPLACSLTTSLSLTVTTALAQTQAPGPTNPTPPNPQAQPGATMVINPTEEECRRGWNASLKWSKEQFDEFCSKLRASR